MLYDKTVLLDGRYFVDGGVADLLPVDVAIKLGCTDVVVVMTRQVSSYRFDQQHTRLVRKVVQRLAKNQSEAIRKQLPTNEHSLQTNLRLITHPTKLVRIYLLEPSNEEMLFSLATIDKDKVRDLARLGITDMDRFLNEDLVIS